MTLMRRHFSTNFFRARDVLAPPRDRRTSTSRFSGSAPPSAGCLRRDRLIPETASLRLGIPVPFPAQPDNAGSYRVAHLHNGFPSAGAIEIGIRDQIVATRA